MNQLIMYPIIQQALNTTLPAIGSFSFPVPTSNIEIFWTLLGLQFGHSFGSKLDQTIKTDDWFKGLLLWQQELLGRALDFTHHWQYGAFMWLYAFEVAKIVKHPVWEIPILFFGFGLMLDDIRDIENLKRRYGLERET